MKEQIIKITRDKVVFRTETHKEIGNRTEVEIELPKGINMATFSVNGIITDCRPVQDRVNSTYLVEMRLDEPSEQNRLILDAYVDFLEKEVLLEQIRKKNETLHKALNKLSEKMTQVIAVAEFSLEKIKGKQTLH